MRTVDGETTRRATSTVSPPTNTIVSDFGLPSNDIGPRILQLAVKIVF